MYVNENQIIILDTEQLTTEDWEARLKPLLRELNITHHWVDEWIK